MGAGWGWPEWAVQPTLDPAGQSELRGGGGLEEWGPCPAPAHTLPSLPRPPQEMVHWFNALRAARFHYLQVAFPGACDADVSGYCC